MTQPPHFVIVGNSVAGIEAAIALRKRDAAARITVISSEHPHPFARTSLMYVFCGQLSLKDTQFYPEDLYDRLRFVRVVGRVRSIDPARRTLHLTGGQTIAYDTLLLAVGSTAKRLPWPGLYDETPMFVHHFVTLEDMRGLDAAARPGMSVAVIGGGLVGIEVAEVLHLRGLRTHFLVREPAYFPIALDSAESEVVAAHIRQHGVDCRTNASVTAYRKEGGRVSLVGTSGPLDRPVDRPLELSVDLVVGAIGVTPATSWLAGSGIAVSPDTGGIETLPNLESTTAPGVFAAGDCAQVTWIDGSRRPEQLWYTARDQGRVAAAAMLGDDVNYRRGTWYNSAKFFDVEYTTAGFIPYSAGSAALESASPGSTSGGTSGCGGWQTWYQHVPGGPVTQRIVVRDGAVKGFNALGSRWDHQVWKRWIAERRPLGWVLAHMNEARFDEELVAPFRILPTATLVDGA
ncbi:MAG: FAD-dependent oxidoreductase [Myxococcales bacterium]|nr:FAD-dependent oxidoreductase [Myxococcales bacterium]